MKKGVNFWCFDPGTGFVEGIRLAHQHRFDGVELILEDSDLVGRLQRFDQARTAASDLGIELPSLATDLFWRYPLSSADVGVRAKAKDVLKRQLETANRLGAANILVVPGVVTEDESYDAVYERALEALAEASAWAEVSGVKIAVENVWNRFLLSPLEFRDFLDRIQSPWVTAYFDVGNVAHCGYPQQWIRILRQRIYRVHVKDFRCAVGTMEGFTGLFDGDLDWAAVMAALTDIGYLDEGFLITEVPPYRRVRGNRRIAELSASLDAMLSLA